MGMTTTLTARDLSDANYPEFVAWVQDIAQACWTVWEERQASLRVTRELNLQSSQRVKHGTYSIGGYEWSRVDTNVSRVPQEDRTRRKEVRRVQELL